MGKIPDITQIKSYLSNHYEFRYNLINNEIQCKAKDSDKDFEDVLFADLYCELLEQGYKVTEQLLSAILKSSFVQKIDFFKLYFESLIWNGNDEIEKLASYVKMADNDVQRWKIQFKKWLIRSVACSIEAKFFNKQCLVLMGNQNDGKSTYCEWLVPPYLSEYWQRGLIGDVKDQQITLASNFLINLDELAVYGKFNLNGLKSMFSQPTVKVRPPYEKKYIQMPRRANFVASTNERDFLTDATGSVRWLCFEINEIDFAYSKEVDINQVWAQAYSIYKSEGVLKYEMTRNEVIENETSNSRYTNTSVEEDLLRKYYVPSSKDVRGSAFYTATEFLTALQEKEPTMRLKKIPMGKAAVSLGFDRIKYRGVYGYFAKIRVDSDYEEEEGETTNEVSNCENDNIFESKLTQNSYDVESVAYGDDCPF